AIGNEAFEAKQYTRAFKLYDHALKIIQHNSTFSDEEKAQSKPLVTSLNLNLALVHLKRDEFVECRMKADEVLKEDSRNLKALVRRAQAHIHLVNNDLAKEDLKLALEIDPDNDNFLKILYSNLLLFCVTYILLVQNYIQKIDVKKLIAINKKRMQQHKQKDRQVYGRRDNDGESKDNKDEEVKEKNQFADGILNAIAHKENEDTKVAETKEHQYGQEKADTTDIHHTESQQPPQLPAQTNPIKDPAPILSATCENQDVKSSSPEHKKTWKKKKDKIKQTPDELERKKSLCCLFVCSF
ncbi:hypothetical protein RFI_19758, partial [Reticulomyxa filosa]